MNQLDPTPYAAAIATIAAVGIVIDSLEVLSLRRDYGPQGILNWDILKLDSELTASGRTGTILRSLLATPGYLVLILVQLVLALGVVAGASGPLLVVSLASILVVKLLSHLRSAQGGLDGSDQMQIVLFASLTFYYAVPDPAAQPIPLWFIAGQSMLSYVAAGGAKLVSRSWRDGSAMTGIMLTDNYGDAALAGALTQPRVAFIVCWSVIAFECIGPFLVLLGTGPCLLFVGAALLFHVSIAAVMGLNSFLWSFGAALPALLFLANSVR